MTSETEEIYASYDTRLDFKLFPLGAKSHIHTLIMYGVCDSIKNDTYIHKRHDWLHEGPENRNVFCM